VVVDFRAEILVAVAVAVLTDINAFRWCQEHPIPSLWAAEAVDREHLLLVPSFLLQQALLVLRVHQQRMVQAVQAEHLQQIITLQVIVEVAAQVLDLIQEVWVQMEVMEDMDQATILVLGPQVFPLVVEVVVEVQVLVLMGHIRDPESVVPAKL
jgi:hypothetical protein